MIDDYYTYRRVIFKEYESYGGYYLIWWVDYGWTLQGYRISLTEAGEECNISEDELILLRLKYGG